jgi:hypothetical protein
MILRGIDFLLIEFGLKLKNVLGSFALLADCCQISTHSANPRARSSARFECGPDGLHLRHQLRDLRLLLLDQSLVFDFLRNHAVLAGGQLTGIWVTVLPP